MSGFKKGDRVYWWFKNGHAYSSSVSGVERKDGTITRIRRGPRGSRRDVESTETAEIRADHDPGRIITLTTYVLHKV